MRYLFTFAVLALAGCAGSPVTSSPPEPPPTVYTAFRDLTESEKKLIAGDVAKGLKDPESARFTWTKVAVSNESSVPYCATLNAKNSYGGYTGFSPYFAGLVQRDGKISAAALIGSETRERVIIEKMCRDRGLDPYRNN